MPLHRIGMGGGCHWCTEAVFNNLSGVFQVEQGYIASSGAHNTFSEAVIVHYDPEVIDLELLLKIHLRTHAATSAHSMRTKYRSAVYYFDEKTKYELQSLLMKERLLFETALITQLLPFKAFKASRIQIQEYYKKNPEAPFCKRYIEPKLAKMHTYLKEKKS